MPFHVVIPARYASTRLPGKPLLDIGGVPMIQRVVERACASSADEVLVAVVKAGKEVPLTGLKTAMRKRDEHFSERKLGYRSFSAFVKAAEARHLIKVTGRGDARVGTLGQAAR